MKELRSLKALFYLIPALVMMSGFPVSLAAQEHNTTHQETSQTTGQEAHADSTSASHGTDMHGDTAHEAHACHFHGDVEETEYDATSTAFHHISDANVYSIGSFNFPLPCILYAKGHGWDVFSSGKFNFDFFGHGEGRTAYNQYVLDAGAVKRIQDSSFPSGEIALEGFIHENKVVDGENKEISYACYQGKHYLLESQSTADGGLFGGGITSFYDFSLTKNVVTMLLISLLLAWAFFSIAKAYRTRDNMAPKGLQSFVEPIFLFIQDEVAKPFLGHKWEKFLPLLLSLFFFILGLNLFGQIPFLGGSNVTGNLGFTAVLALITFIVVTINGNKHYWSHIVWMPGVPAIIKILILTPVEILGMFIKPFTLMLRLFANITAGHIVVMAFVGLIFMFGKLGESIAGGVVGAVVSIPLTIFIMAIELLVAFIQAYVFTLLTASYIGAATEEHHHAEKH
ncbi:MAG: F0F1 ATP synthase subunit A [Saprospiraceae bacterium]|nr:F0F1 ATP synthase subunit A [Candidatus Opimibacter skivensis]